MSKALWKPEDGIDECPNCLKPFRFFRRKHHCRACGDVYCSGCLPRKIPCSGYAEPDLACNKCIIAYEGTKTSTLGSSQKIVNSAKAPLPYDASKIQTLCESFKPKVMSTGYNVAAIAKLMVEQAQPMVPAPFNGLCVVTAQLLSFATNSVVNSAEAGRLADRVARLSYAILQLSTNPGNFQGAQILADQLIAIFDDAVKLLKQFQPDSPKEQSFVETIKRKFTLYSSDTVNQFADIHQRLTVVMQDRMFVASVSQELTSTAAPTLEQIQVGIQRELSHVLEAVKKSEQEDGARLEHIESQLTSVMSALTASIPAHLQSKDVVVLDPRSVHIDTSKIIGKGASGSVFAGFLYGTTPIAVKVMLNSPATEEILREVKHEMERTIRVAHRNVIKIYGLLASCPEFEGRAAVVMERLGQSLDNVTNKLSNAAAMKLTGDIIAGMARVHDSDDGLVHFDLKLSNIMLTLDGRTAKIVDFGIAQTKTTVAFATNTETARARGTVAYMAPEILLGTSRGFYCDVYSFGTVLYALWSGRKPWQGFSDTAIITAVQQGSRSSTDMEMIAQGMPESIVALILACWDHSPGNRPTFKNMMQIREIDAFWEAPTARWPLFLQQAAALQGLASGLPSPPPVSVGSSVSGKGTVSTFGGSTTASTNTAQGFQGLIGGASVASFTSEQLCSWLLEDQNIEPDIVQWIQSKKVNGDTFVLSGEKIIQKLRDLNQFDDWNIDSLERSHKRVYNVVKQEEQRQKQLEAARNAVIEAAKEKQLEQERMKQFNELKMKEEEERRLAKEKADKEALEAIEKIQREEATKRAINAARVAEYERCRELNLKAVNAWHAIWTSKNPSLVEGIYQNHYSTSWSGTYTVSGNTSSSNDLVKAKASTYNSLKQDWVFLPATFKVLESTDTYVKLSYSTNSPAYGRWTANVRFDFDPPGLIMRSNFVINQG